MMTHSFTIPLVCDITTGINKPSTYLLDATIPTMLRELSIKNFAIIDDLRIEFDKGLTIFSGETGAGKSIIINAVNLLLGARASAGLIRTGADNAELEALFDVGDSGPVADRMAQAGLDTADGLVIRRVLAANNRHRIYINGRLSTIQTLMEITDNLASISGQHAHQLLLKEAHHLEALDQFGGLTGLKNSVRQCYLQMVPLVEKLAQLEKKRRDQDERRDLLSFQLQELEKAAIEPGEDETLEAERLRLKNGEVLGQSVAGALGELYDRDGAVVERLTEIVKTLQQAVRFDPAMAEWTDGISDAALTLEDIAGSLRDYSATLSLDRGRLEAVEERLDFLVKIKRKYGGSLEAAISRQSEIGRELEDLENLSETIESTAQELAVLKENLASKARELSAKRKTAAQKLSKKVVSELGDLKMSPAEFHVSVQPMPVEKNTPEIFQADDAAICETGMDRAEFLIAPNVGESVKPLAAIASGGELSRVVLALKAILAKTDAVSTIIFDEVDAGIGGGVAEVVGKKLKQLARFHQVICITHLPQIARFGRQHYRVAKKVSKGRTRTTIEPVAEKERIEEIARMLGGEAITRTVYDHARELIEKS